MGRHAEAVTYDQVVASLKVSLTSLQEIDLTSPGAIRKHYLVQLRPYPDQDINSTPVPSHRHREVDPFDLLGPFVVHGRCLR